MTDTTRSVTSSAPEHVPWGRTWGWTTFGTGQSGESTGVLSQPCLDGQLLWWETPVSESVGSVGSSVNGWSPTYSSGGDDHSPGGWVGPCGTLLQKKDFP